GFLAAILAVMCLVSPGESLLRAEENAIPWLRLVYYRGPGGGDRITAKNIADGDEETEWQAAGLQNTTLGPPFEFVFEFFDGGERELAGIKLLGRGPVVGHRGKSFEIRIGSAENPDDFSTVIYAGEQSDSAEPQSHLFAEPISVKRFMFKLISTQGDPDFAQLNELWPIFDAAETANVSFVPAGELKSVPLLKPEPADPLYADNYPYRPISRAAVPLVEQTADVWQPIDAWLLEKLEAKELSFAPLADRDVWLRRVTYDLTGLPPTLAELDEFIHDDSLVAREKVVDRLLSSPRYGERMAQHWLDLVRYADTDGFAADGLRQEAWRFRDYVIAAFNDDKPYDRFVAEHLAADELEPLPYEALPALGFNRMGPFRTNSGNQNLERNRQELLIEMTGAIGTTFLGLTVNCARCHDHKIDPIPQADYYRLESYFAAAEPAMLPMASPEEQRRWNQQTSEIQQQLAAVEQQRQQLENTIRQRLFNERLAQLDADVQQAVRTASAERTPDQIDRVKAVEEKLAVTPPQIAAAMTADEAAQQRELDRRLQQYRRKLPSPLPQAWAIRDAGKSAPTTYVLHRGMIENKVGIVAPQVPTIFPEAELSSPQGSSRDHSTGRRLALAKWLVGPGQSQTARVMANRLWQYVFARGIVATPNNFGDMGYPATHPELLDWLAGELIDGGWTMKRIHRMLVLSRAYAQSSMPSDATIERDESNSLWSRAIRRRLSAEEIRDSLLAFSGTLEQRMHGPGVTVPLPDEVLTDLKGRWRVTDDVAEHNKRSVYLFVERKLRLPFLENFDQPDSMTACAFRVPSTHALQSLALVNNEWVASEADRLASLHRWEPERDFAGQFSAVYRLVTARAPNDNERAAAQQYFEDQRTFHKNDDKAWTDLCQVVLNLNRFLYLD
ncbi:MAG: DUF1549 domain-containing protein, partial [Planctomycetota bacterium]|nr:DUF1549 domain-containing protein [Planctomycetota bacterium]